jgi:hypothetical protein
MEPAKPESKRLPDAPQEGACFKVGELLVYTPPKPAGQCAIFTTRKPEAK